MKKLFVFTPEYHNFLISGMIWQAAYETGQFALYNDYEHFHLW